jgi:hypothetical protein
MREIKGFAKRRGLTMNQKGFAKKERFHHEEERFCLEVKV